MVNLTGIYASAIQQSIGAKVPLIKFQMDELVVLLGPTFPLGLVMNQCNFETFDNVVSKFGFANDLMRCLCFTLIL